MSDDRPIHPPKYLSSERLFGSLEKLSNPSDQDWPPEFFDAIFPPESRQIEEIDHGTHIVTTVATISNDSYLDIDNVSSFSRKA